MRLNNKTTIRTSKAGEISKNHFVYGFKQRQRCIDTAHVSLFKSICTEKAEKNGKTCPIAARGKKLFSQKPNLYQHFSHFTLKAVEKCHALEILAFYSSYYSSVIKITSRI